MIQEFRLSARGSGRGVSCDADGAFVGAIPLLKRSDIDGAVRWEPRDCGQLSKQLSSDFGLPIDVTSKRNGLKAICNALNDGDVARAQIATVLLAIPEPPPLSKGARSRDAMIKFIRGLDWSGLIKAEWDSDKHPRWPAKTPDHKGGEFAPKGFWQELGGDISQFAQGTVSQVERIETDQSNSSLAVGTAEADAIATGLKDYANYRAQPWLGLDGKPVQVSTVPFIDPITASGLLLGYELTGAPLTRPGTNADWIDPLTDVASLATMGLGPAAESAEIGTTVAADSTAVAADSATAAADTPFIIRLTELPSDFNPTWPIGRFVRPTNAVPGTTTYGNIVGKQIGDLVQDAYPDVQLILRTSPGMKGVDIEAPFSESTDVGFRFMEIKPVTNYGFTSFNSQVTRWKLPDFVHAITYDYQGKIYYGFPW